MPKIEYKKTSFRDGTLVLIEQANEIIEEYRKEGFVLTLRQLYYQFVARGLIANKQREYKRLGGVVADARLAGLLDWGAIEDRGRNLITISSWDSPADIVSACAASFKVDRWEGQRYRPEVWIEKEALIGVVSNICNEWRVPHYACKGYVSLSEMWAAGHRRFRRYHRDTTIPIILHFGDHDPSGIDMTRDIATRARLFARQPVEVRRLALNMNQVEEHQPPPNPAKVTDSRFAAYVVEYGEESWELDALEPKTIAELIEDQILKLIDPDPWAEQVALEEEGTATLEAISDNWGEVEEFATSL